MKSYTTPKAEEIQRVNLAARSCPQPPIALQSSPPVQSSPPLPGTRIPPFKHFDENKPTHRRAFARAVREALAAGEKVTLMGCVVSGARVWKSKVQIDLPAFANRKGYGWGDADFYESWKTMDEAGNPIMRRLVSEPSIFDWHPQ